MIRNMKKFLCALMFVFMSFPAFAQKTASGDDFVSGFEDLPLPSGLVQLEDGAVSFDSPAGRIVEAYAESPTLTVDKIRKYYADTLVQLGWKQDKSAKKDALAFTRDGETLRISFEKNKPVAVRFELTTQP